MHNLNTEETAYFSDENNWRSRRGYELRLIFPAEYPRESFSSAMFEFTDLYLWESQPENPYTSRSILPVNGLPKIGLQQSYGDINTELAECTLYVSSRHFARTVGKGTEEKIQTMDRVRLAALHEALFSLAHAVSAEAPVLNATICFEDWGWLLPTESGKSISISTKIASVLNLSRRPIASSPWLAVIEALA